MHILHTQTYTHTCMHAGIQRMLKCCTVVSQNNNDTVTTNYQKLSGPVKTGEKLNIDEINKKEKNIEDARKRKRKRISKDPRKKETITDKKNSGIWIEHRKKIKKIAAIGIRVRRWVAYHGFSINVSTDLKKYKKIIPCGIKDKNLVNLNIIKKQTYKNLKKNLVENFIKNLKS